MAQGEGKRWFKYGCFGCLGVMALLVIVLAVVTFVAWMGVRNEQPETRTLQPDFSSTERATGAVAESPDGEIVELPVGERGRLIIDVRGCELAIAPAPAGESLRIEANYDPAQGKLEDDFQVDESGAWTYSLTYRGSTSVVLMLRQLLGGSSAEITVHIPQDLLTSLEANVREGALTGDIGGLSLHAIDIELAQGGMDLGADAPMRTEVERWTLEVSMGGGEISSIGNVSPRVFDVTAQMSGLVLDMRGAWVGDSEISLDAQRGGGKVRLPSDVDVFGMIGAEITTPRKSEMPRPKLTFTQTGDEDAWNVF